jgi:hypothetical protein
MENFMNTTVVKRVNEKGNVLFLILIAVALFAALSYAVTKSTRSGGGTTDRERAILSGATLTQHPTALRTSLIRMILAGTDVTEIFFNPPAAFGAVDPNVLVFHPDGGGALFQNAPADIMAGGGEGVWNFNGLFDVPEIGVSDTATGNDLVAFLPGVTQGVCIQINDEFQFFDDITDCTTTDGVVPDVTAAATTEANFSANVTDATPFVSGPQEDLVNANVACTAFRGDASGCFFDSDNGEYVFYSVLIER